MLAKLNSKNQITLPSSVTDQVGATDCFEVEVRGTQIVLTPVCAQRGNALRAKLEALSLSDSDIRDAVSWARPRVAL